ncbi:sulfatase-like hydrolase/transferase [Flavivirga abyssicola]|uniref:sulfatase-like hydrolase/transferase n=1 Tax=Flavivirga abyssicola TaxID=3063533 RepID=UPI0026E03B83|nr:sulfatase-like hydrolase/transferase [Flavivirga sp. MEBiC07777]WVK13788.1 sulfatase-like hydrolase/transferase [Flavivirga sp. MEBiC07777]
MKLVKGLLIFLACFIYISVQAQDANGKQPNIIIILSDDQGWGDVGFNGGTDIPTPNLNLLAEDGVVFSQGYSTHPYCSPSRAGLVSGRYQQQFGHENNPIDDNENSSLGLPLNELIISELLQKHKYRTCAIGKWHLGNAKKYWPSNRGFDDWYGFTDGGFDYWGNLNGKNEMLGVLRDGVPVPANELSYLTDDFSNEAVKYIDTYSKSKKPFFMYLAYNAPHAPIQATKAYTKKVKHIEDGKRAAYAAMVVGMDAGIGKVIQKLKDTGEYENTIIFFYSDNGGHVHGASSAPFRGHKGMLFEGGIREPFVISWPDKIKGNRTFKQPIIALDIYPTILAAANIKKPKNKKLDGINLLPYLESENKKIEDRPMFWRYSGGKGYAIRSTNYKLIYSYYKKQYLLFDIEKDPYEHNNIAANHPEIVDDLKRQYDAWDANNIVPLWSDPHIKNVIKEEKNRQYYIDKAQKGERSSK